jgi:hypothetical protein
MRSLAGSRPAAESVSQRRWQTVLLLLQPPLTLAYLLAVRRGWVEPSYAPIAVLALCPLAVLLLGRSRWAVMAAVLELGWAMLAAMSIGFAIAWQLC